MYCHQCGNKTTPNSRFCEKCGQELCNPDVFKEQILKETVTPKSSNYPYLISTTKLLILTISTLGFYKIYWFYRHFSSFKAESYFDIKPFRSALVSPLSSYLLFKKVADQRAELELKNTYPGVLAFFYFILSAIALIPYPYIFALISLFSVVPLILIQRNINEYWKKRLGTSIQNTKFNKKEMLLAIFCFALSFFLLVIFKNAKTPERVGLSTSQVYRIQFMKTCTQQSPGNLDSYCSCVIDYLEANATINERIEIDALYSKTGILPEVLSDAILSCSHKIEE